MNDRAIPLALSPEATLISVSNTGIRDLTVSTIALVGGDGRYAITNAPALPAVISAGQDVDIEVQFTPAAEVITVAVVEIASNDPDPAERLVSVGLVGNGVVVPLPPGEQVQAILDFIATAIRDGSLVGNGSGNSGPRRLNALINMVGAIGDLIEAELIGDACDQTLDALQRTDGLFPPPDFAAGAAAADLKALLQALLDTLGCPAS